MTPRPLNIPSNNPILAKQREHSTCIQPSTTLNYPKSRSRLQKPPAVVSDIPPPCGHQHDIRPLIPKLFRRRSGKSASGVSSGTSFEISRDVSIEDLSTTLNNSGMLVPPWIELKVLGSQNVVEYSKEAEVWVCIEATVKSSSPPSSEIAIPSMRFCYKPVSNCTVLEVLGSATVKDLKPSQVSQLFLRLSIPKLRDPRRGGGDMYQWSSEELYEHLESMLGVHEMECLQIEVKYRYPNVPADNVMTVKQVWGVRRVRGDCVWGKAMAQGEGDEGVEVRNKLARVRAIQETQQRVVSPVTDSPRRLQSQPEVIISQVDAGSGDTARALWHDLKRTSLSSQQLVEMSPERVEQLAASDAALKARRQQALANKRSVGAETLRAWKWEENVKDREGEMPWL